MNNIEFINDTYTEDGLRLPIVHFDSNIKDICVIVAYCNKVVYNIYVKSNNTNKIFLQLFRITS